VLLFWVDYKVGDGRGLRGEDGEGGYLWGGGVVEVWVVYEVRGWWREGGQR